MTPDIENEIKGAIVRSRELPPSLEPLHQLSRNFWWGWARDGTEVFRDLDPSLWQQCEQNPRLLLTRISDLSLAQIAADPSFVDRIQKLHVRFKGYMNDARPWAKIKLAAGISTQTPIAYFCAEFGVHNSLPLYSGGLGILAGDHLKSASDLNLPLVAVGLMYRFGYFRQRLSDKGWQEESYRETYPNEIPIHEVNSESGQPAQIEVAMRGRIVR